jgi:hypothetical protein
MHIGFGTFCAQSGVNILASFHNQTLPVSKFEFFRDQKIMGNEFIWHATMTGNLSGPFSA